MSDEKEKIVNEAFILLNGEDKLKEMARKCIQRAYFPEISEEMWLEYQEIKQGKLMKPLSEEEQMKHLEIIKDGLNYIGIKPQEFKNSIWDQCENLNK